MDTPTKRCSNCNREFPNTPAYFHRDRTKKDGLYTICKCCTHAKDKLRYANNPEPKRVRSRQWRKDNPDKAAERNREYHNKHPEKKSEYGRRHRIKYHDKISSRHKKYATENKDKVNTKTHRYVSRKRALPATFTDTDWQRALDYFKGCCAVCGRPPGLWHGLSQDHWIPTTQQGGYVPENIVPLCYGIGGCNHSKGDRAPLEWLEWKFGARKAKRVMKNIMEYFEWAKAQR